MSIANPAKNLSNTKMERIYVIKSREGMKSEFFIPYYPMASKGDSQKVVQSATISATTKNGEISDSPAHVVIKEYPIIIRVDGTVEYIKWCSVCQIEWVTEHLDENECPQCT